MRAVAYYFFGSLAVFFGILAILGWIGTVRMYRQMQRDWARQWSSPHSRTVFLSYRHKTREHVKAIRDALERAGLVVKMSDPDQPYESPIQEVAKQIEGSIALILVHSEMSSDWIAAERQFAKANGLPIFEIQQAADVEGLIGHLLESKPDNTFHLEPDDRFENLVDAFGKVAPDGQMWSPYWTGENQHHFHTISAFLSFGATSFAFYFGLITWFLRP